MSSSSHHSELTDRGHEKFVELCAVYTSGSLDAAEQMELNEHLAGCDECQKLLADYRSLVHDAIPLVADRSSVGHLVGYDLELADTKRRLFASLPADKSQSNGKARFRWQGLWKHGRLFTSPALRYAALLTLGTCVGWAGYMVGIKNSTRSASVPIEQDQTRALRLQLSDAIRDRASLRGLLEHRNQELQTVRAEIDRQVRQSATLQQVLNESEASQSQAAATAGRVNNENTALKAEREEISRRLDEAQSNVLNTKQRLEQLEAERVALQVESSTEQRRIEELNAQVSEQQRLLAADRDIRELMGARDLLLADLYDVDRNGHNKTPFGRIFYTKNKSLVFYAFDLDKQTLVRNAKTFQAWGARATARGNEDPISLGIFYLDNANARRWLLKLDDPKTLERIDSVFVTVEPEGGSRKPSNRQLLFTYLRGEANHP
jgi:hypothetical protein